MPRGKKAVSPGLPENENDSAGAIAPSVIQSIALGRLMRAPENVRQTNKAVDVESLADDIAAHGLLQSLIGYAGDTDIDAAARSEERRVGNEGVSTCGFRWAPEY